MKKKTAKDELSRLAKNVLNLIKTKIYINLPYMGPVMDSVPFVSDLRTDTFGTDGISVRFNPNFVLQNFLNREDILIRGYMQMLIHCVFCHMYRQNVFEDKELYYLCCDISAESIIDDIDDEVVYRLSSDFRDKVYSDLSAEVKIFTPERLYEYYSSKDRDYFYEERLSREFSLDDHSFWQDPENKSQMSSNSPQANDWKNRAERLKNDLVFGNESTDTKGSLEKMLKLEFSSKTDYKKILEKYAVVREEARIDPDTFDYGLYMYGFETYGNMPLIEENEYTEKRAIEDLVIAIDTSASCQGELVKRFLNETSSLLLASESFFKHTNIVIIECDNQIQKTIRFKDPGKIRDYAEGFSVKGGFGTDFRPVFNHVEDLKKAGELQSLKALLYFTDGMGEFPKNPTTYETSFVLFDDKASYEAKIPSWANTLYFN